jgi:hypothetical protein
MSQMGQSRRFGPPSVPPKLVHPDFWLSELLSFHNIAAQELSCVRAPARKRVGSIQPPVPQPRACISSGRASKNCLAQRSLGRCGCDLEAGATVNMRGRLYRFVACLIYQAPNVAAGVASAANRPLTNEPGGQRTPRRARGFPMWTFLAINPRAGRNSRRYPRKFRARGVGKNPQSAAAW